MAAHTLATCGTNTAARSEAGSSLADSVAIHIDPDVVGPVSVSDDAPVTAAAREAAVPGGVAQHARPLARTSTSDTLTAQVDRIVDSGLDTDSDDVDGAHRKGGGHGDSFVLAGEAALSLAATMTPHELHVCAVCDDELTVDNAVALPCTHVFCREVRCVYGACAVGSRRWLCAVWLGGLV